MYICEECGQTFEEPKIIEEHHPYGMGYAVETFAVCPNCGEAGIEKMKQCSRCGEYVAELKNGLCDIWYSDMYD